MEPETTRAYYVGALGALRYLELTREDLREWRPPEKRGRWKK